MSILQKIDSNLTGLRYALEASLGVLPATPTWIPLEPNSYQNFGGQIKTVAREPINASRQRRKGTVTDLTVGGSINQDLVQSSLQDLLQGYFFADFRRKLETVATAVTAAPNVYDVPSTTGAVVGSLVFASGFSNAGNNGLKTVTAVTAGVSLTVAEATVAEAAPPATNSVTVVGYKGAVGDIDVVMVGSLPTLHSHGGIDFTTLGLIPGEWIFIGGDAAGTHFVNATNGGFARVKTITATDITLDKTLGTFVNETGTGLTIELFFGRVLKNESDPTLIKRRTYHIERTLAAPDPSQPAEIQAEYLVGAVPNTFKFNFKTADKITIDMDFVGTDNVQQTSAEGLLPGTRPSIVSADAYNTASDFVRLRMSILDPTTADPTPLFAFMSDMTITINNNLSPNKALSKLGAFEVTEGFFNVDATATAYFSQVEAVQAVRQNADVTLDFALVKNETVGSLVVPQGLVFDLPLVALGDGRLNVALNQPIDLNLTIPAAADRVFNHTALMVFYDYLPAAALPA